MKIKSLLYIFLGLFLLPLSCERVGESAAVSDEEDFVLEISAPRYTAQWDEGTRASESMDDNLHKQIHNLWYYFYNKSEMLTYVFRQNIRSPTTHKIEFSEFRAAAQAKGADFEHTEGWLYVIANSKNIDNTLSDDALKPQIILSKDDYNPAGGYDAWRRSIANIDGFKKNGLLPLYISGTVDPNTPQPDSPHTGLSGRMLLSCGFEADAQQELPLPEVPSELRQPQDRAEYIIAHFWNAMEFSDTLRSRDRKFMEQNMVNWLALFPHAREKSLARLVDGFLMRAGADSVAFRLVIDIAEEYLYTPYSPIHNEGHFILFFERLLKGHWLNKAERLRPEHILATAKKNRPGTKAADFRYVVRLLPAVPGVVSEVSAGAAVTTTSASSKGLEVRHQRKENAVRRLHKTKSENLLLVFYSPDCHYCKVVTSRLVHSAVIQELTGTGKLSVLAVCAGGNRELWDSTKDAMPESWTVGFETGKVMERELYALPSMPVIYLLDRKKKVLLKEATVEETEEFLAKSADS